MKCADVHLSLGAEPASTSPELEAHLRECPACAEFRREMLQLDEKIRRALMIDVSAFDQATRAGLQVLDGGSPRTDREQVPAAQTPPAEWRRRSARRHYALAASLLVGVLAVLVTWGVLPSHSLAADVVSHVLSETIDQPLDGPVDEATVRAVMEQSGLRLDPINPSIVFMRTCFLRGRLVPHFIVRTDRGLATVMILPDEPVKGPEHFSGSGYKGVLVPDSGKGSIAVMSREDGDMEKYAIEIRRAVHALPAKFRS
jgi:anti-sigma factor RsiW